MVHKTPFEARDVTITYTSDENLYLYMTLGVTCVSWTRQLNGRELKRDRGRVHCYSVAPTSNESFSTTVYYQVIRARQKKSVSSEWSSKRTLEMYLTWTAGVIARKNWNIPSQTGDIWVLCVVTTTIFEISRKTEQTTFIKADSTNKTVRIL